MILYLDTSVLVTAMTPEAATSRMQSWLEIQEPGGLAISDWVATEFSSALSIKVRSGQIEAKQRASVLARFAAMSGQALLMLPIAAAHFATAARFADQHALGLRAGDALHLAVCADHGATLCTLDRRLADAGPALGVSTALL